jgi:IS30 family transposase
MYDDEGDQGGGPYHTIRAPLTEEQYDEIIRLTEEGKSSKAIAEEVGVFHSKVKKIRRNRSIHAIRKRDAEHNKVKAEEREKFRAEREQIRDAHRTNRAEASTGSIKSDARYARQNG